MLYSSLEEIPSQFKTRKDCPLNLEQANYLASIFDAAKKEGVENPVAIAWTQFENKYEINGEKWEAKKEQLEFAEINSETGTLSDVEIMSTGTWKGWNFSESDLDGMVSNFKKIPFRVALKVGHGPQDLAKKEGLPALGWVTELKRVGKKLLASFSDIPKKLADLIKKKNYIRFSSEVRRNFAYDGNTYDNVLRAVALLGEEWPAVQTLDDIYNLHAANAAAFSDSWPNTGQEIFANNFGLEGGSEMNEIETLKSELEKKNQELASQEQKIAELQLREKKFSDDAKRKEIYSVIDVGVREMKISPAAREVLAALALKAEGLIETEHKFSDGGKDVIIQAGSASELIGKFSAAMPEAMKTTEKLPEVKAPEDTETEVPVGTRTFKTDDDLHKRITNVMAKNSDMSYSDAFAIVADEIAIEARKQEVN